MLGESLDGKIDADEFDRILAQSRKDGTQEAGDLTLVIKPGATTGGRCAVLVTFTAMVGGKPTRVQAVTTGHLINMAASMVRGVDDRTRDSGDRTQH